MKCFAVALVLGACSVGANAASQYDNPALNSVFFKCREQPFLDQREACIHEKTDGWILSDDDTYRIWGKLLINEKKPYVVKTGEYETLAPNTGSAILIRSISDKRQFDRYIGNNSPHAQSADSPLDTLSNAGLIGRVLIRPHQRSVNTKMGVHEARLVKGKTASSIVRRAVTNGLERGGYQVISPGAESPDQVIEIDIEIHRFWVWHQDTAGGWGFYGDVDFIGEIGASIFGDRPPFKAPVNVDVRTQLRGSSASRKRSWTNITTVVLKSLVTEISKIQAVGGGSAMLKTSPTDEDLFTEAKKCQDKDGVWINDICQIQID